MLQSTKIQKSNLEINKVILQDNRLSFFQKIILVTDGTVTDLLGLYTGQTIFVKKLGQEITISTQSDSFLCEENTPLLKRSVLICSNLDSYVYAESTFIFGNLSRTAQYKLLETDQPIGLIWKEEKLESYREVIDFRTEVSGEISELFDTPIDSRIVSRTYLIFHNNTVLGTITEKFPITKFRKKA